MIDIDTLARIFATGSYKINEVHRVVIQPKSILREFKTVNSMISNPFTLGFVPAGCRKCSKQS